MSHPGGGDSLCPLHTVLLCLLCSKIKYDKIVCISFLTNIGVIYFEKRILADAVHAPH